MNTNHFHLIRVSVTASLMVALGIHQSARAQTAAPIQLTVQAGQPGARINPAMWGIFFEDINLGADGGLYAELVKNRGFEFPDPLMGWSTPTLKSVTVHEDQPFNPANPHYLRLNSSNGSPVDLANEGFRGIGVRAGEHYEFSAQVRSVQGAATLTVELLGTDDQLLARAAIGKLPDQWSQISARLTPTATDPKARLNLKVQGTGTVDVDFVSLFPQATWKGRPGGMRPDMVQALADLKPGFLRFPGGCIVEGSDLEKRYQWKNTIGPVEERELLINRWNYEFSHRPTPDYFQTFGLGFFEYFQLAEDFGAEPLPILNCGMACQFNSGELVPLDQLDPYIQDALDLIEFANGPVTSPWGARRAAMGHPEPFNLKMLGIGNEQWGPQYVERLAAFASVLKAKHPEILLVGDSGPSPADERFEFLWPQMRELNVDIVDEHCYANPIWFLSNTRRYDDYDRNGPKVFFGEYAAQSDKIVSVENRNNWECALAEAAFLTGVERNADVVSMASYAPLFGHVDGWQWRPDLIWVDNLRVLRTPNYQVQQLFMHHRGDVVLPVQLRGDTAPTEASGGIVLSTYGGEAEFKDIVVTSGDLTLYQNNAPIKDLRIGDSSWRDYTLQVKARKLSGKEGFIIGVRDEPPNTRVQWNLGGWGNTRHGIQSLLGVQDSLMAQMPGRIETDRWYDVKIELSGTTVNCYLDGLLLLTADVPLPRREGVFASAVRDENTGEIILKVANVQPTPTTVDITLNGVTRVAPDARVITLSSALQDENTFERPTTIAPTEHQQRIAGTSFPCEFAANSFTVLRIQTE